MTAIIRYTLLLAIAVVLIPYTLTAGQLKGSVKDNKGQPLPFATVYVKGTTLGTTANENADYILNLPDGTYAVLCQFMGYEQASFSVTISGNAVKQHNFVLTEQSLQMNAVVVRSGDEDPAYGIIRKAIKKRKQHLKQTENFQSSIYLKGVLRNRVMPNSIFSVSVVDDDGNNQLSREFGLDSNGRGVLYLCEEHADYYVKGNKRRTVIKSVKESGDPGGLGFSSMPAVINFYENNLTMLSGESPRGFVSPISDNAIHYYRYKYEGEYIENGHTINRIKVTPRREYEPLFTGYIYIVERDWAIHSLEMLATGKANLESLDTLLVKQQYVPLGNDQWVIKSQVLYPTISIFGLDISGHFLTVYDEQKIGGDMPDSLFQGKVISSYMPDANKKDSVYWVDNRPVQLQDDEVKDYVKKDSLARVYKDPQWIDSVRRRSNRYDVLISGIIYNTKGYKHKLSSNSIASGLIQYNTVEGITLAPQMRWQYNIDTGKALKTIVAPRYGFGNKHFNLYGKLSYEVNAKHWEGRSWVLGAEGGKYAFQYNSNTAVNWLNNSFSSIFYSKNYMKLYDRWTAALFVGRNYGNGFSWELKAGFQRRVPLQNTTFYTFVKDDNVKWTDNYPASLRHITWEEHDAVLLKAEASYTPGVKYVQYPDRKKPLHSKWPTLTARYDKGVAGVLDSKTNFDKWKLSIKDEMNMKLLGTLAYNIAGGGFINSNYVSLPDMTHFIDNQLIVATPYLSGFLIMPYYKYSNTESLYGEAHVEYNLNGLLTNKVPLLRSLKWYLILGNNTYYGGDSKNWYTEAFVSLDNIGYKLFRGLRVDFVHSWDSDKEQHTGVRFGLNLQALIKTTTTNSKFKW